MNTKILCAIAALLVLPACKKSPPPMEETPSAASAPSPSPSAAAPEAAPAGDDEYATVDPVPGAGAIAGTVTYAGKETDSKVTITKDDATCCAACAVKERMSGSLVVDGGKLANAVVWLPDVKKGKKMDKALITLDNKGCAFEPHVAIGYKGGNVAAR